MNLRHLFLVLLLLVTAAASPPAGAALPAELAGLGLRSEGEVNVLSVEDGGVLVLADRRQAVLAGIEVPRRPLGITAETPWPAADHAWRLLHELVTGQPLTLLAGPEGRDRYGRLVVQGVTADGRWLQAELLRQGWARVATTPDTRRAAAALLNAEDQARKARLGLWALAPYAVRHPGEVPLVTDRMQVIEGRVSRAYGGKRDVTLRMGWSRGLVVRVPRPVADGLAEDPHRLTGWRIRVRGWIIEEREPVIEVSHPEQIELLARPGGGRRTPPARGEG